MERKDRMIFKEKHFIISILIFFFILFFVRYASGNDKIMEFIKHNEGLRLTMYKDPSGDHYNIAYGHNLNYPISARAAEAILKDDIKLAQFYLKIIFNDFDSFPVNKKVALTDMMFAMGPTNFSTFKNMIEAVKAQDWKTVAEECLDSDWASRYKTRSRRVASLLYEE